ncbi:MAG: metalloregulator ArsR/SmtB family transcription factor [Pseudomonadota bacterium]
MQDTASFFKVLADETRLRVLWLLFNHRELCVCDILAALDVTQSKVSRHLATLRHAGLVSDRKDGLWSYYALRPVDDALVAAQLEALRASLARRADAAALLDRLHSWLAAKNRNASCTENGACASSSATTRTRAPRARSAPRRGRR